MNELRTMAFLAGATVLASVAMLLVAIGVLVALWRLGPTLELLSRTLLTIQLEYSEVKQRMDDIFMLLADTPLPRRIWAKPAGQAESKQVGE